MTLREILTSFAIVAGVSIAQATDYYWIGGAAGDWADGQNWSLTEGGAAAGAYPNTSSGGDDHVFFGDDAAITLKSSSYCRKMTVNAQVMLKNGKVQTASSNNTAPLTIDGTGKLILSNAELVAPYATSASAGASTITCALEIADGTTNTLSVATGNTRYSSWTVSGKLTGSGALIARGGNNTENYIVYMSCDASEFAGSFVDIREGDTYHARVRFTMVESLSPLASYHLVGWGKEDGKNYPLRAGGAGVTYQMGALNGTVYFDGNNNTKNGQYFGYALEIGGKNEDCAFDGTLARGGYASYTKKVGTADMTFSGSQIPNLDIADGTYIIGAASALPTTMKFTGGAFSIAEGVSVDPVAGFSSDSTAAVKFDDRGINATWTGVLNDARLPHGFVKRGAGTLALASVPVHTTVTTIEEGRLLFPVGSEIACLDVKEGASVGLYTTQAYTDPTEVLTIRSVTEGTNLATAFPNTPAMAYEFVTDEVTGVITVKATRAAAVFTWTGATSEAWENAANWTVGGEVPATAPTPVDSVVFPVTETQWTVEMNAEHVVAGVAFNGTTKLIGASLRPGSITGEGRIVLGDAARIATYQGPLAISNDVEIVASAEAPAELRWSASSQSIELAGAITGSGVFKGLNTGNANYAGIKISGDMTGFTGTFMAPKNAADRNMSEVRSVASVSSNAIYDVEIGNGVFMNVPNSSKLSFGMLTGSISQQEQTNVKNLEVEIDCLGLDGSLGGSAFSVNYPDLVATRGHVFKKVGAGTVALSLRLAKEIELNAGVLEIVSDQVLETMYKPKGGAYEITTNPEEATGTHNTDLVFGGGMLKLGAGLTIDPSAHFVVSESADIRLEMADDRTFATALPETTGGLVKKGAGTLTLAASPAYTGMTRIEDGSLVVNGAITLAEGSTIVVENPAAACAAGTVFLQANAITGHAAMETSAADASKYKLSKFSVMADGRRVAQLKVNKVSFSITIR